MARRRKGGIPKIAIGAIIVVFVAGGLILALPSISQTGLFGVSDQFPVATNNADFWAIPASFYFAITPVDGIHCWIASTLTQGNIDGTQEVLASNTGQGLQLFEITGGFRTSAKEVSFVKDSPRISCEDQSGQGRDIRLVGGTIRLESFVRDSVTGVEKKVDSRLATIPALNRNLNVATGGGNILLPTLTSQASTIESLIVVPDTVASRNIDIIFRTNSYAQLNVVGDFTPVADLKTNIGGLLKFINPEFGASLPPTVKGTQVTMTLIDPIQHHYIGSSGEVPSGVGSSQIVTLNDEMRATFTGTQDNWSGSEGVPTLTIKDPRGVIRASGIPMTSISTLGGGITQFSRIGVSIPFQITDSNIDVVKGTWTAEMHQAGRTAIGAKTFALLDSRPAVVNPTPTCNTLTENLVNGVCVPKTTTPPPPSTCPTSTELGEIVSAMSNDDLISAFNELKALQTAGTLTSCENTQLILVSAEVGRRGLDTTVTIPTGDSLGTSFIRFSSSLTDESGNIGGGGGCPITGQVPTTALPVIGLQLLGLGTCDGLRFGSVELTPTLDFGAEVNSITIDASSIRIQQDLFLAKNNPYPAKPTVSCTTPTTTSIGICTVTNHVFANDNVGDVFLTPSEVTFVRQFVDKATSGEYQVTKVVLQENSLIDKIQRNGVALADGDEVSLMYLIWGTFSGSLNGSPFIGSVPAMTFVQSFTFKPSIGIVECNPPSMLADPNNPNSQCLAPETCPAGTTGTFPNCVQDTTCSAPNTIVNGVCSPPTGTGCTGGQVRDPTTSACRDPEMCFQDPVCSADEKFSVTQDFDDCGANILICIPRTTCNAPNVLVNGVCTTPVGVEPCPNPDTQFRDSIGMCVNIMTTGCAEGEARNSLGICEPTGGLACPAGSTGTVPNCVPDGNEPKPINFCQLGAEGFNFAQCLSSIFSADAGMLMIGGTTQSALIVVVMIAILLIVIAIVVRVRRGGIRP